MTEEPEVRLTLRDADSVLVLSKGRSEIIARGRKDSLELLARPESVTPVPLSKSEARKLAEDGDPVAQCDLGAIYENAVAEPAGRYRVRSTSEVIVPDGPGDYEEAVRWYRKAARQGHADGQWCLGIAYENGDGVITDFAEAARWYLMAAEQGHAAAQWYLGDLYERGEGVDQDSTEALRWYRRSADGGNSTGQEKLTKALLNLDRTFCKVSD